MTAPAEPRSGGEALARAALAVVQSAVRTTARGAMTVPDFQIDKLRRALSSFEPESSPAWTSEAPKVPGDYVVLDAEGERSLIHIDGTEPLEDLRWECALWYGPLPTPPVAP